MSYKVNSVESFFNQLPRLNEKMDGNYFYRGQSKESYKLTPSVLRGVYGIIKVQRVLPKNAELKSLKRHLSTISKSLIVEFARIQRKGNERNVESASTRVYQISKRI